jgi:hypothetical protein
MLVAVLLAIEFPTLYWWDHGGRETMRPLIRAITWDAALLAFMLGGMAIAFCAAVGMTVTGIVGLFEWYDRRLVEIRDAVRGRQS